MPILAMKRLVTCLRSWVAPRAAIEDVRRKEFILNILLMSCISLLILALGMEVIYFFIGDATSSKNDSLDIWIIGVLLGYFFLLYKSSRRGFISAAAYGLVGPLFLLPAYMGFRWGVDLPAELVFYPLVIVMAGVLISTRVAFLVTGLTGFTLATTWWLQTSGIVAINSYWETETWTVGDVIMIVLIYGITVAVSWLSNREIEHSLVRARISERELKEERDLLEVRVQERTEELQAVQLEKMRQAYRFVEFGRLAAGLFHDLMSPLTALSLNIENITNSATRDAGTASQFVQDIHHAQDATAHMQKLVEALRRHIAREGKEEYFCIRRTLEDAVRVLHSYARQRQTSLSLETNDVVSTYGDPIAFIQVVTNILSNAIEAGAAHVTILMSKVQRGVEIKIEDDGPGMNAEIMKDIFEPFFSTKGSTGGLGIGLPSAQRIIEKEFGGTIQVDSAVGWGTKFTIYFPIREP